MTGDVTQFINLKLKAEGHVTYGDNNRGKILGRGDVGTKDSTTIENVLYVEGLKHSLLSISQLCDKGYKVNFEANTCTISNENSGKVLFTGKRVNNIYLLDIIKSCSENECLLSKNDESWLWHRRLAHIHTNHLNKLKSKELVSGLPNIKFQNNRLCDACVKGKQIRTSFKSKDMVSSNKALDVLHMDLFGPSRTASLAGNYYALVIVDDFSRYTWTLFLASKNDAYKAFKKLAKVLHNENENRIKQIRSTHGGEFQNAKFDRYCEKHGIIHSYSAPRTPQQNGVVERKNRSLEELARTMLNESGLPKYFWADAVYTASYVLNRTLIRPILKKTPYELYKGRKPSISHLRVFGCKCFVLNNGKDNLGKFDPKSDEGIHIGYAINGHAYRVYNKRLLAVEESIHVVFDETDFSVPKSVVDEPGMDDLRTILQKNQSSELDATNQNSVKESTVNAGLPKEWKTPRDLKLDNVIGKIEKGVSTRNSLNNFCRTVAFVSQIEPKSLEEALQDSNWITAMQEELNQFEYNEVWTLVPRKHEMNIIGTKWVYRNKMDEHGAITRNKARLVAKGYNQEEGIDFGETYAPVARLEAVRLLLAFSSIQGFKLFQMDVKSAFLNGYINEEVFVSQPPGFEDHKNPEHVYMLKKALYGLKQAPRQWYERLSEFLLSQGYSRGNSDKTLFLKKKSEDIILVQVYVDDIIFGSTNEEMCEDFVKTMKSEFEMSMLGEMNFFLGLQVKQLKDGIFISQEKYCKELLKKFDMNQCKAISTPISTSCQLDQDSAGKSVDQTKYRGLIGSLLYLTASRPDIMFAVCLCARYQSDPKESHYNAAKRILKYLQGSKDVGLWYPNKVSLNLIGFSDSDFAGCKVDRKSTSGTCHMLGSSLISWHCKKQACVALSTAEAEYIAAGSCCAQTLWLRQQLSDFGILLNKIPINCDNTSAINLSKNPVMHSRTKHIEIRHHFLREHIANGTCDIQFIGTEFQLADLFTKPLAKDRFHFLLNELGIISLNCPLQ